MLKNLSAITLIAKKKMKNTLLIKKNRKRTSPTEWLMLPKWGKALSIRTLKPSTTTINKIKNKYELITPHKIED